MSSESIKSGMSFWLICLSTFLWACLSVPYWIVKSQHCYRYVTRPLCTFVTALVKATLFVLLNATFEKLGLALGIALLAALIQTIKKDGFQMKVQRMHGRDPSEASPYAKRPCIRCTFIRKPSFLIDWMNGARSVIPRARPSFSKEALRRTNEAAPTSAITKVRKGSVTYVYR